MNDVKLDGERFLTVTIMRHGGKARNLEQAKIKLGELRFRPRQLNEFGTDADNEICLQQTQHGFLVKPCVGMCGASFSIAPPFRPPSFREVWKPGDSDEDWNLTRSEWKNRLKWRFCNLYRCWELRTKGQPGAGPIPSLEPTMNNANHGFFIVKEDLNCTLTSTDIAAEDVLDLTQEFSMCVHELRDLPWQRSRVCLIGGAEPPKWALHDNELCTAVCTLIESCDNLELVSKLLEIKSSALSQAENVQLISIFQSFLEFCEPEVFETVHAGLLKLLSMFRKYCEVEAIRPRDHLLRAFDKYKLDFASWDVKDLLGGLAMTNTDFDTFRTAVNRRGVDLRRFDTQRNLRNGLIVAVAAKLGQPNFKVKANKSSSQKSSSQKSSSHTVASPRASPQAIDKSKTALQTERFSVKLEELTLTSSSKNAESEAEIEGQQSRTSARAPASTF